MAVDLEALSKDVVAISTTAELKKHLRSVYIMEDYMHSEDDYAIFQERMYNIIKGCFEYKELREYPVKVQFYRTDKKAYKMQLRHFVVNIMCWSPLVHLYGVPDIMDVSFIVDCTKDIPHITDYINEKIITLLKGYSIANTTINFAVSKLLYNLRRISIDFSVIMNLTLGSENFLFSYRDNKRLHEIMETEFCLDMQPADVEEQLNKLNEEEIEIFKSIPNHPVGVILTSQSGIKTKQLGEFTIADGLKPDLNGITIPIPISTSTLIGGSNKPSSAFIEAGAARKSLIMNKKVINHYTCHLTSLIAGKSFY